MYVWFEAVMMHTNSGVVIEEAQQQFGENKFKKIYDSIIYKIPPTEAININNAGDLRKVWNDHRKLVKAKEKYVWILAYRLL